MALNAPEQSILNPVSREENNRQIRLMPAKFCGELNAGGFEPGQINEQQANSARVKGELDCVLHIVATEYVKPCILKELTHNKTRAVFAVYNQDRIMGVARLSSWGDQSRRLLRFSDRLLGEIIAIVHPTSRTSYGNDIGVGMGDL
jgi:hypothetical protein